MDSAEKVADGSSDKSYHYIKLIHFSALIYLFCGWQCSLPLLLATYYGEL